MRGTVTGLKRSLSGMFFIEGDDGITYFSHKYHARDRKNVKKYLYNGNKAEFSIIDEGKDHLTAIDVFFDEVADPDAERKREARIHSEEQHRINEIKKEQAYVKNLEEQVKFYQKQDFESRIKYVVQIHNGNAWENFQTSDGKLVVFSDPYKANGFLQNYRGNGIQMRIRKARVCTIKGKTVVQEIKK